MRPQPPIEPQGPRILIAGVGNELLSDDGVGVHAVRELQRHPIPGVLVLDLGTAILHALSFVEQAERVLIIDAARGGRPPGTIYLFEADDAHPAEHAVSIHSMGLHAATRVLMPGAGAPPMTVIGVEPATLDYGMSLSAPVEAALPQVVALALETVAGWLGESPARDPSMIPDHTNEEQLCRAY